MFAFVLLLIFFIYILSIFAGNVYFTSMQPMVDKSKVKIFVDIYKVFIDFYQTSMTMIFTKEINKEMIDIPTYWMYAENKDLEKLNENLPDSGMNSIKGYLEFNNKTYEISARYRGDMYYHWNFKKKSWRINLKGKMISSSDKFNIINPKYDSHLRTLLGYHIAEKVSLISPRSYHVALFLNDEYQGVYYYSDQIDESFIQMLGKRRGDIIFGDVENDKNLFEDVEYWDIQSMYDGDTERAKQNIKQFISSINYSDEKKFYDFFNKYLGDEYLKFYAYNILLGDYHVDENHNHKFYFNPDNEMFEPIVWDQASFSVIDLPINSDHNAIFKKIILIPEFVEKKNKYIKEFIDEVSEEEILEYINAVSEEIEYEIEHDKYKDSMFPPWTLSNKEWHASVEQLKNDVSKRYAFLHKELGKANATIYVVNNEILVIDVDGISPSRLTIIFESQEPSGDTCVYLRKDKKRSNKSENYGSQEIYCTKNSKGIHVQLETLYPGYNGPLRYIYLMETTNKAVIKEIEAYNTIILSEINVDLVYVDSMDEVPDIKKSTSLHPWEM